MMTMMRPSSHHAEGAIDARTNLRVSGWWSSPNATIETPPDPRSWFTRSGIGCTYPKTYGAATRAAAGGKESVGSDAESAYVLLWRGFTTTADECREQCAHDSACQKFLFDSLGAPATDAGVMGREAGGGSGAETAAVPERAAKPAVTLRYIPLQMTERAATSIAKHRRATVRPAWRAISSTPRLLSAPADLPPHARPTRPLPRATRDAARRLTYRRSPPPRRHLLRRRVGLPGSAAIVMRIAHATSTAASTLLLRWSQVAVSPRSRKQSRKYCSTRGPLLST